MDREMMQRQQEDAGAVGLRDTISGLFDELLSGKPLFASRFSTDELDRWSPAVDVFENADEIVVRAALPGVKKEDVELEVKDGLLMLSGKRESTDTAEKDGWMRREIASGSFYRAFKLTGEVQADKAKAQYKDGILEIRLPKAEQAKPRKVRID